MIQLNSAKSYYSLFSRLIHNLFTNGEIHLHWKYEEASRTSSPKSGNCFFSFLCTKFIAVRGTSNHDISLHTILWLFIRSAQIDLKVDRKIISKVMWMNNWTLSVFGYSYLLSAAAAARFAWFFTYFVFFILLKKRKDFDYDIALFHGPDL